MSEEEDEDESEILPVNHQVINLTHRTTVTLPFLRLRPSSGTTRITMTSRRRQRRDRYLADPPVRLPLAPIACEASLAHASHADTTHAPAMHPYALISHSY